jgi:hypothetical protein
MEVAIGAVAVTIFLLVCFGLSSNFNEWID